MNPLRLACLLAVAAAILSGCQTPTSSGRVYSSGQARQEQTVRMAVVESVREVIIEGSRGPAGTIAGGAIGGSTVGSILGAVAGGVAGQAIERNVTERKGLEITVRLENGELRAITQDADEQFRPGERVRLLSGNGVTRVSH